MSQVRVLWLFFKRDLWEALSYKLNFLFSLFGILFSSATFYFISQLISGQSQALNKYGGNYFSFVIIGLAFSGVLNIFQEGLPGIIRNAQLLGTLEALLITPTPISMILIGSSLYPLIYSILQSIVQIGLALVLFGLELGQVNWVGAGLLFGLTILTYMSIGVLSASFILVYKLGNPFSWAFGSLSALFGGVFFPVAVLPDWLRWISSWLPITYSLEGLRKSLLLSLPLGALWPEIRALLIFSLFLVPLSLLVFRIALKKAKKDGTLTHY
jgi:ABC-2 type transport system permease protein